jgi:hypothetical protein
VAKKKTKVSQSKDSMVSKVEVKTVDVDNQDRISRILGTIFIALGLIFVLYGVFSFIKYTREPQLDESFQAPFISGTVSETNQDEFEIKGVASGYNNVYVYVDDKHVGKANVDKEGNFTYKYKSEGEGKYVVSAAGIKGFPKRYISVRSTSKVVEVDKTAPVLGKVNYPVEVGTETFAVSGNVEPGCQVVLKRGTSVYDGECDDSGNFVIKEIALEDGPNVFSMEIKDKAGNVTNVEEKIRVTYSSASSVNGNAVSDVAGATDSTLPVASGELSEALNVLFANKLMMIFGILAVAAFMFSSGVVIVRKDYKRA